MTDEQRARALRRELAATGVDEWFILRAFAAIRAEEREECAKECEVMTVGDDMMGTEYVVLKNYSPAKCAAAIRARGKP